MRTAYLLPKVVSYIQIYLKSFHNDPPDPDAYLFYSRVSGMHGRLSEPALAKRIKLCAAAAHEKCPDKQFVYLNLLTSGRLNEYLASVDEQAEDIFSRLVKEYADKQGVTEQLKAKNQLEWVGKIQTVGFS